jgi:tetratricopeptide (TPR) repeat protein
VDASIADLAFPAENAFAAADFKEAYRLALEGLNGRGEHPGLLAIAGRAALELGLDEAVTYLGRLVELTPADAAAWRDLGAARLSSADLAGADQALRTAVRLDPAEPGTRVSLGHLAYLGGAVDEAERQLAEAARLAPADATALRSLTEMRRLEGRSQAAIAAAEELLRRAPDDIAGTISLAELNLSVGNYDKSLASYRRLCELDTEMGHAGHIIHGMVEVEIRRERWRHALDHAIIATALDRHRLTTDLLAFVTAQLFGRGEHPAPSRAEIESRLQARRAEHRRLHAELFGWGA